MNSEPRMLKAALRKRAAELQKIMNQMKQDNLKSSKVFQHLEQEIQHISLQLNTSEGPLQPGR